MPIQYVPKSHVLAQIIYQKKTVLLNFNNYTIGRVITKLLGQQLLNNNLCHAEPRLTSFENSVNLDQLALIWAVTRENLSSGLRKVRFKPACSATETSLKYEISQIISLI